jgi:hypothetical protein
VNQDMKCADCAYSRGYMGEGHCPIFYEKPAEPCMQHTERSTEEVLRMSALYLGIE